MCEGIEGKASQEEQCQRIGWLEQTKAVTKEEVIFPTLIGLYRKNKTHT